MYEEHENDIQLFYKNTHHTALLNQKNSPLLSVENIPMNSLIIYVSHEWLRDDFPDNSDGKQIQVLCSVLQGLRNGDCSSEMIWSHVMSYQNGEPYKTSSSEWKIILENAYIWFDWFSIPQPFVEKDSDQRNLSVVDQQRAMQSLESYVDRADFVLILTPTAKHSSRLNPITKRHEHCCFRSWRTRALGVREMFAAFLSRRKTHPLLLVRSAESKPVWISANDAHRLCLGHSKFTCCEQNHSTELTQYCRRTSAARHLSSLLEARVKMLFAMEDVFHARIYRSQRVRWLRGLVNSATTQKQMNLKTFAKERLMWKKSKMSEGDGKFFDCNGVSLLIYTLMQSNESLVQEAIKLAVSFEELESRIRKPCPEIGLYKSGANSLIVAMMYATPEIVSLILNQGVNPGSVDDDGVDALTVACSFGHLENVRFWFKQFPQWDVTKCRSRSEGISSM